MVSEVVTCRSGEIMKMTGNAMAGKAAADFSSADNGNYIIADDSDDELR